jgi:hypothetical protein
MLLLPLFASSDALLISTICSTIQHATVTPAPLSCYTTLSQPSSSKQPSDIANNAVFKPTWQAQQ